MRALLALLLLTACAESFDEPRGDCNPIDTSVCALPWPSSFYEEESDTPTGVALSFGAGSLPVSRDDVQTGPTFLNQKDGFAISGPILAYFADLSTEGLIRHDDIDTYLAEDARTVLVDIETGERVPHFSERDRSTSDEEEQVLLIRPVQPLRFGAAYAVGVRGLVTESGGPVAVSDAFLELRDDTRSKNPDVARQRAHYDEVVFPALDAAGVPRDELQLAWDFTTASRESVQGPLRKMVDESRAFAAAGISYTLDDVETFNCESSTIGKQIEGTFTAPLYTEEDGPGTVLNRGEDGMPVQNGTTEVEFLVRVPCSVIAGRQPAALLQYGHGILGSKDEARTGWLSAFANERRMVVFAVDWTGMKEGDLSSILEMIVWDPTRFAIIPERTHQGLLEQVLVADLMMNELVSEPELQTDGGVSLLDPERIGFYGNSQGAIFGGAYMAVAPEVHRGVLGVGGAPYHLLLDRSNDFTPFFRILKEKYSDQREVQVLLAAFQTLWDGGESAGWGMNLAEARDGGPQKQVLLQTALGDAQVNDLGSAYQARMMGAVLVTPAIRGIWGVDEQAPGFSGNAWVEFGYTDVPAPPFENLAPNPDTDTHECPRRDVAGQQQVFEFLSTGVVNHTCDGPCLTEAVGICL